MISQIVIRLLALSGIGITSSLAAYGLKIYGDTSKYYKENQRLNRFFKDKDFDKMKNDGDDISNISLNFEFVDYTQNRKFYIEERQTV